MNLVQSIVIIALMIAWFVLIWLIGQLLEAVERYLKNNRKLKSNIKYSAKTAQKGEYNVTSNFTHTV